MENYLLIKSLHVLGAVLFLGNILVTALWKVMADRTKNPIIVAYSQRLVTITDFVFTAVGAALTFITGRYFLVKNIGEIDDIYWLSWGYWLFVASGILWVTILIPVQIMQARLARTFQNKKVIPEKYWRLSFIWATVGSIAVILPFANLYFMIFKPMQ